MVSIRGNFKEKSKGQIGFVHGQERKSLHSERTLSCSEYPEGRVTLAQQRSVLAADHAEKYRSKPDCEPLEMLTKGGKAQSSSWEVCAVQFNL